MPILRDGQRVWVEIEEFDTCGGILPGAEEYFEIIPRAYLSSGKDRSGKIGAAQSYLLDASDFVEFAIQWLENRFQEQG